MKKINFSQHILPHAVAIGVFLIVTIFFFKPVFFDNKKIHQDDIEQWEGSSKELRDYRKKTGDEGLWASSMFSGMPAYLINVEWSNKPVTYLKTALSLALPHPVANIYLAFLCYYILLLTFGIRPYLAIAGALAFGLSSYMIVGIIAGHNARVGAIAFMPLIMAGIHLVFSGRMMAGVGVTIAGFALHLRENHLQITYYLAFIVVVYGIVQLIHFTKEKQLSAWFKNVGVLIPAVLIGVGTFMGPLWAITEYTEYSIRGKSELASANAFKTAPASGLGKEYAFEFSNGLLEPMTLLVPNIYGGASSHFFVQDDKSNTFQALVKSGDQQSANQLASYTSAYWGPQRLAIPYYAGAIIVTLFVVGIGFADRKWVWWLVPVAVVAIMLSWGKNFQSLNYFLFDYFPGYNKFRSVTFALIIALFALPLLGMLGVEKIMSEGLGQEGKKKLLVYGGITAGICLLLWILSGMLNYTREFESQLPPWLLNAMIKDRRNLMISDAFRSLGFIIAILVVLYFELHKKISPIAVYAFIIILVVVDMSAVDNRYLTDDNYQRKRAKSATAITPTAADEEILKDKSHYRVFTLGGSLNSAFNEARTSYFHKSIGGYHGAKMYRYQDLLDSCLYSEIAEMVQGLQTGKAEFDDYGILNMLNVKYIVFGADKNAFLENPSANGNAWFVRNIREVKSPAEELAATRELDTKNSVVIDGTKFDVPKIGWDSLATIELKEATPNYLKYESNGAAAGLAVFSEIYYEKGWKAFIDNQETTILRANYILRALPIAAGKHTIEFRFQPNAYRTGNTITAISSWLMLLALVASMVVTAKKE